MRVSLIFEGIYEDIHGIGKYEIDDICGWYKNMGSATVVVIGYVLAMHGVIVKQKCCVTR